MYRRPALNFRWDSPLDGPPFPHDRQDGWTDNRSRNHRDKKDRKKRGKDEQEQVKDLQACYNREEKKTTKKVKKKNDRE